MSLADDVRSRLPQMTRPDSHGRYKTNCPFHDDKHPSFQVLITGGGTCYSACNRPYSVREVAERLGIPVPDKSDGKDATYDYFDEKGKFLFQVVRYYTKTGLKKFYQRRQDPSKPGEWINGLSKTRTVLYRLPELLEADPDHWVFVVEGEKDVGRLRSLGLVATTNPMGAGKWSTKYSEFLKGRMVAILPDNDPEDKKNPRNSFAGQRHADHVARSLTDIAAEVKVISLPNLPSKGDVSNWLDDGGTWEKLLNLANASPIYIRQATDTELEKAFSKNGHEEGNLGDLIENDENLLWAGSKLRPVSQKLIKNGLMSHGEFIRTDGGRYYFFDNETKILMELGSFDIEVLINEKYGINSTEQLSNFLQQDMLVEAAARGKDTSVRQFAHYDSLANILYLDMGRGRVLRLDGKDLTEVDNGTAGILFMPYPDSEPWYVDESAPEDLLVNTVIDPINFVQDETSPHSPDEQKVLFLLWMLAVPFESIQPTKPLALALGPAGSGKTLLFRRIGRLMFGHAFDVDSLRKDGEDDFYVSTTNRPFVAFDNADRFIPWLEDALAVGATGQRVTKRELYTTNRMITYISRAFIALTARTPRFRREDVSERLIIFHVEKLTDEKRRAEQEMIDEVSTLRNPLLTDFARLLNRVVAETSVPSVQMTIRLADFAKMAGRAGLALGIPETTQGILKKLKRSQYIYATEENELAILLDAWLSEKPSGALDIGLTNEGRWIGGKKLYEDLKGIALDRQMRWRVNNEVSLGKQLTAMEDALSISLAIERKRVRTGTQWRFLRLAREGDEP